MPGTAVTKSVVANEPGGRKREEIFVDIIEKISVTFSSSVRNIWGFLYHEMSKKGFSEFQVSLFLSLLTNFLQGYILTSEIDGTIQMKSYLTGNPEICLALNEDLSIGRGSGRSLYGIS